MKESDLVAKIKKWLSENGVLCFKYHGSVYGVKGHADLYGVLPCGKAFFLEVKVPGKKPEPWQESFLRNAEEYGAVCGWCDSVEAARRVLRNHLVK